MTKEVQPQDVTFEKKTLELINELTKINTKLMIEHEEVEKGKEPENIIIDGTNPDTTIAYKFSAPKEHFEFEGDEVAFYDYSQFFELLSVFDKPKISQIGDEKFEIKQNKSKITYFISDSEAVDVGFSEVDFKDPELSFCISDEQFKDLRNMLRLIEAENVTISVAEDTVTVKLSTGDKDNSYETQFKTEEWDGTEFSITLSKDIWEKAPEGSYDIQVKQEGIIRLKYLENDAISLDLYTAEIEEE